MVAVKNAVSDSEKIGWPICLAMAALMIAEVVGSFESIMIYAAMPTMYKIFNDPIGVGWLITAFLLVSAAAAAICSRLGDLFGRRKVLVIMLLLSGSGSLISALSDTLGGVIAGRAIQGAYAAIMPLCFGIAREILPKRLVPVGIGILVAAASVSAGVGLLLGGAIVDYFHWRWIFIVPAALAAVTTLLVLWLVPVTRRPEPPKHLDFVGGILFVPAITAILIAISNGRTWGWGDAKTLGFALFGVVMLIVWIRHELRQPDPLIDVRQFGKRHMSLTLTCMALYSLGAVQIMLVLMLLLQQPLWTGVGLGVSATLAALVKLPSNALAVFAAPWSGVVAARHGARRALIYGVSMITIGWVAMTFNHNSILFLFIMVTISSFGGSVTYSALANLVIEAAPQDRTSEATGLAMVVRTIFTAIGAQMVTFLLATETVSDPAHVGIFPSAGAYQLTFAVITTVSIVCVVAAFALPRRKPPAPRAEARDGYVAQSG